MGSVTQAQPNKGSVGPRSASVPPTYTVLQVFPPSCVTWPTAHTQELAFGSRSLEATKTSSGSVGLTAMSISVLEGEALRLDHARQGSVQSEDPMEQSSAYP